MIPKKAIPLPTLKRWSTQFNWADRVKRMDAEAVAQAEALAIQNATLQKSKILQFVKNVFVRANQGIVDGTVVPTVSDVKRAWEIMRVEQGLKTIPEEQEIPRVNIFLTKNPKIIQLYKKASDDLREALANGDV